MAYFGKGLSETQYQTVVNRFSQLQEAKKYANTLEDLEQPIEFSFSCHDYLNECEPETVAYVKVPEANVVTLCPRFFTSTPLAYICESPYYLPSNPAVTFQGAYMCSDYDASYTIWHIDAASVFLHEFMHLKSVMNSQPLDGMSLCIYVSVD